MTGPLDGIRVLALEQFLAGNHMSWLLGMFGAEVIKVERPEGDTLRTVGPFATSGGVRRGFAELRVMTNKKSVALDLGSETGREVFFKLAATADVVWSNFKPSSLAKLGISFDTLTAARRDIIFVTLSGFGHDDVAPAGPFAALPAFDLIAQGMAGLQLRGGRAGDPPSYNGLPLGDEVTSLLCAFGVALALQRRNTAGGPQRVDVAMHDAMVFLNELPLGLASIFNAPPRGHSGTSAPYGPFRARDGWVNITVGSEPVWRRLCLVMCRPDLVDSAESATAMARVRNRELIEKIVSDWTAERSMDELVALCLEHQVPCAPIFDLDEVLASPQVAARHMLAEYDDPIAGSVRLVGNPIKMNDLADGTQISPAPLVGVDTRAILRSIGLSDAELDSLEAQGVVR